MQDTEIVTARSVIDAWEGNLATREAQRQFNFDMYEERVDSYTTRPSFDQYQAISAYIDCMWPGNLVYETPAEKFAAYEGTFGTLYQGFEGDALQVVLDDHYQAMTAAHDREIDRTLGGIEL